MRKSKIFNFSGLITYNSALRLKNLNFAVMNNEPLSNIRSVGIFCGSSAGDGNRYIPAVQSFGRLLADKGIRMVYGGGNIGLMGIIADAMLEAGGEITGVIPGPLIEKELAHSGVNDMRVVDGMNSRKDMIFNLSDAFIALPGGYGTMDEIFEMLTRFQLGFSRKPCGLLNLNGFYDHLINQLDLFVRERFLSREHRGNLFVSDKPDELLAKLDAAVLNYNDDQGWIEELKTNNRY